MLARRLQGIPPTIFSQMSALAVRTGAVNLGQGFPDVDGPPSVIARAVAALEDGANQYAPGIGIPPLRQAIARHQQRHYGIELDPDREVVVTTGCTEGIAAALLGLVDEGDEVIVLEPYYDSYVAMIQMAGGVRRPVTLRAPDYRLDVDALRAAVGPRPGSCCSTAPHNPTGTVLTPAELQAVADVAIEHDLVVITDEVYEHLTFDGHATCRWRRCPACSSAPSPCPAPASPTPSPAGRSAGRPGPAELVDAVLAAKQWLTFTSGSPLQPAVALALDEEPDFPRPRRRPPGAPRPALRRPRRGRARRPRAGGHLLRLTDIRELGWEDGAVLLPRPARARGRRRHPAQVFHDDQDAGRHLVRWAFCKEAPVIEDGPAPPGRRRPAA